jgi:hypothetical protein
MSNVDYRIKILTPSLKNALALPEQNFIPLEIKSKRALLEPDKTVNVIDAFEQTNVERNEVKKYRLNGKLEILTDNTIISTYGTIVPNDAWSPVELDNLFLPRTWVLQITYPKFKNNFRIVHTDGFPNPTVNTSTKAHRGFQVKELIPFATEPIEPSGTPGQVGSSDGIPEERIKYRVLIRTAQRHGVENIGDFIYLSPITNFIDDNVDTFNYLGYHRVSEFEVGNEDYGLVLDTEYIIPTDPNGDPVLAPPFFGVGKTVFEPSADDIVFLGSKNVDSLQRCDNKGQQINSSSLTYIKIFSQSHGLRVNDFIEVRDNVIDPINNLYKIIATPNINEFVIQYNYTSIDNTTGIINRNLKYRFCDGVPSEYYYRDLEVLTEIKDCEVYKAGFSVNVFDDPYSRDVYLYHFDRDIDVENLRDNLNRPLSELFLTVTKRSSSKDGGNFGGFSNWGNTFSILDTNKNTQKPNLNGNSPTALEVLSYWQQDDPNTAGTIQKANVGNRFIGDFVSYSRATLSEKVLSNATGRFGVTQVIIEYDFEGNPQGETLSDENGYTYQLHQKIKIRDYSDAIETVPNKDDEIFPDYAQINNDGTVSWRDLLDIGFLEVSDNKSFGVDYPFVNGKHYLYTATPIYIRKELPTQLGEEILSRGKYVQFDTDNTPNDEC